MEKLENGANGRADSGWSKGRPRVFPARGDSSVTPRVQIRVQIRVQLTSTLVKEKQVAAQNEPDFFLKRHRPGRADRTSRFRGRGSLPRFAANRG
jgi:hypothetical protein